IAGADPEVPIGEDLAEDALAPAGLAFKGAMLMFAVPISVLEMPPTGVETVFGGFVVPFAVVEPSPPTRDAVPDVVTLSELTLEPRVLRVPPISWAFGGAT